MPLYQLKQVSFLDLQAKTRLRMEPGSLCWLLAEYREVLFPDWLSEGWARGRCPRGAAAYPVAALAALWLLRWSEEGMSRRGACRRAKTDFAWQVAMGLPVGGPTPSARTMSDFEAFMGEVHEPTGLPRYLVLHEHVVHLVRWLPEHQGRPPVWVVDSTPMWCFGAILDTVRLLGDGLRRLGRRFARAARRTLGQLAKELDLDLLLAKSTKGHLGLDWRAPDARSTAIHDLVNTVLRVVDWVREHLPETRDSARPGLLKQCDVLLRVIEQDLEQDEEGRWTIARRVARDRVVSLTDPEARHGHKSRSATFWGFELNVLGDAQSGLIAAVSVTAGNGHDAEPGHALVERVQAMRLELKQLLADTAYGGTEHRLRLQARGVELVAPPPPVPQGDDSDPERRFGRHDFDVDMEGGTARCPNGVSTLDLQPVRTKTKPAPLAFRWPVEACAQCPLQTRCLKKPIPGKRPAVGRPRVGRRLQLHPLEAELIASRKRWEEPEVRARYRLRSIGERLHVTLIQHGARRARRWGLAAANQQVHAIAIRCNLGTLARSLAKQLDDASAAHLAA